MVVTIGPYAKIFTNSKTLQATLNFPRRDARPRRAAVPSLAEDEDVCWIYLLSLKLEIKKL